MSFISAHYIRIDDAPARVNKQLADAGIWVKDIAQTTAQHCAIYRVTVGALGWAGLRETCATLTVHIANAKRGHTARPPIKSLLKRSYLFLSKLFSIKR